MLREVLPHPGARLAVVVLVGCVEYGEGDLQLQTTRPVLSAARMSSPSIMPVRPIWIEKGLGHPSQFQDWLRQDPV